MLFKRFILLVLLSAAGLNSLAQSYLRVGLELAPMLCFTSVSSLGELKEASSSRGEPVNFKGGLKLFYETPSPVGFSLGAEFSRKRFGFLHEEDIPGGMSLLGHGELLGVYFPAELFITVVRNKEPFFELVPYAGMTAGWDYSTYRNLTRLDNNYDYTYSFERYDYEKKSFGTNAYAGINVRTIIKDLGFIEWGAVAGMDIGSFPTFDYSIDYNGVSTDYSESLRMIYFTFHVTYCFLNFEIFNGRFLRRRIG